MTRSNLDDVPFNPFVSFREMHSEDILSRGYMVIHDDEVPVNAEGFFALAKAEPEGSQRRHALGLAAAHVSWVAELTQLPQDVIVADRRLPTDGSIRLVLSQVIGSR